MTALIVSLVLLVGVVGPLAGWAIREQRRRARSEIAVQERQDA
jgi:hypothetical protein